MNNSTVISLESTLKHSVVDGLTALIRSAAQAAIESAVQEELAEFISQYKDVKLADGKYQIVKNGFHPTRAIATGVGQVEVKLPRVRDRSGNKITFKSSLIPPYMRRTATLDVLLPLLYLKGVSTNNFQAALEPMLGTQAKNISPSVICELKKSWLGELKAWQERSLAEKHYVYWWVDGVYLSARMESDKNCMLVIIGATADGKKELIAFNDGFRESEESWLELFAHIRMQGLVPAPALAIGDGSLGFWSALEKVYPDTKQQRCWVHKTGNILNKLPKSQHQHAKGLIQDMYMAADRQSALQAYDAFIVAYDLKYDRAVKCLQNSQDQLFSFYDFPAEHWVHIRSTNPIESTFATVKHRTRQARNSYSRDTLLAAFFKLMIEAEKRWVRLRGKQRLAEVINMVKFIDGVPEHEIDKLKQSRQSAA